jgi:hypothetical protein
LARIGSLFLEIFEMEQNIFQNPTLINSFDEYGRTPLHFAVNANNCAMIEYLLKNGADANQCDIQGTTPIHLAAINGSSQTLLTLLKFGKNLRLAKDMNGRTPLEWAKSRLARLKARVVSDSFESVGQISEELEAIISWLLQIVHQSSNEEDDRCSTFSSLERLQQMKQKLTQVESVDELGDLLSQLKI